AEDAAKSTATYQEAAFVDPDIDTAEQGRHNPEVAHARVASDGLVGQPVQDAGTERKGGPGMSDGAQASQEYSHGRRKEDL
ncbi:MAG: hypothetical protein ABI563_15680, partial [Specibacter sp.]